ncbi:type III-A CRISPR-associated protein Cas10/Csm1 [Enterococcus asini]|uniref:CRISPR system single-strand-specific deoxyribonuclease Cas10/Csm1 (subtype III-A) n=1 Tax=Enterococcus asini TaxID=57732 RepID=A0AAW8TYU4_9ENTE|nr:type III-A CRISPR-associated protein Cas10/Csm1 [Enterococcus asini]MDT2808913.1 type III-A CRISPR-associated protein Cas10/Csm1 [Enterococcus asini]
MEKRLELMVGSLLHDIGKIIYRCNDPHFSRGTHSKLGWEYLSQFSEFKRPMIKECIKYHHYKELSQAHIASDSPAYITYIADNIASGADRRDEIEEGDDTQIARESGFSFDKYVPLSSVFNVVNEDSEHVIHGMYPFGTLERLQYPSLESKSYTPGDYAGLKTDMDFDLAHQLHLQADQFGSLLLWTESLWSYIPSSTNKKQLVDISLYDHSRLTCALAIVIQDWLIENKVIDYKKELFSPYDQTKAFYDKEAFLLTSMDLSGVQDFIYNISGAQALKSLRARSFYLEILLESVVDELLGRLGLSRANLLYTGGGHAYLILANTQKTREIIDQMESEIRKWCLTEFKTDIALMMAYQPCSGNDLMNTNGTYRKIWQQVSGKLSDKKAHRYTLEELLYLNETHSHGERECRECLRSDTDLNDEDLCPMCAGLIRISSGLRDKEFFVVAKEGTVSLPFEKKLSVTSREGAEKCLKNMDNLTIYSKNHPYTGQEIATNLWMCDYDQASRHSETREEGIASYAKRSQGIKRLGVLRADVDNLGAAFIKGIPDHYNSLSRTATLSRNLSMFFKFELNHLLAGSKVTCIYAGGDDLFMIGAWDDITVKALEIRKAFADFTLGKLSLSAGIGLYPPKYPVARMASEVGKLEDQAKTGEKDQITLWLKEKTYDWNVVEEDILGEKLQLIQQAFTSTSEHGKSFIYKIIELLRGLNTGEQINVARLAYLLARSEIADSYSPPLFTWAQDPVQRERLVTALEYYVYEIREGY